MTQEDVVFLKQLQQDLKKDNPQLPVFWVIMDYKRTIRPHGWGDEEGVYYDTEVYDKQEFKEFLHDCYSHVLDVMDYKEIEHCYTIKDIVDYLTLECGIKDFKNVEYVSIDYIPFVTDFSGAFLTEEDANKHLKECKRKYTKNAYSCGIVPRANPRYERLIEIIKEMEFE